MKALITIKRITEYSSIVEMDEKAFLRLSKNLEGNRLERRMAETDLNHRIDTRDWQDDEFHSLEDFKRAEHVEPEKAKDF